MTDITVHLTVPDEHPLTRAGIVALVTTHGAGAAEDSVEQCHLSFEEKGMRIFTGVTAVR